MKMNPIEWIAFILVVIGGLNWGLVGAFGFNLVDTLVGSVPTVEQIVYILVGLSALYLIVVPFMKQKSSSPSPTQM